MKIMGDGPRESDSESISSDSEYEYETDVTNEFKKLGLGNIKFSEKLPSVEDFKSQWYDFIAKKKEANTLHNMYQVDYSGPSAAESSMEEGSHSVSEDEAESVSGESREGSESGRRSSTESITSYDSVDDEVPRSVNYILEEIKNLDENKISLDEFKENINKNLDAVVTHYKNYLLPGKTLERLPNIKLGASFFKKTLTQLLRLILTIHKQ